MCRALKPLVNEDIFRIKDADESLSENVQDTREKSYNCDSDRTQPWNCQTCGCSNPVRRSDSSICRQCGTKRG